MQRVEFGCAVLIKLTLFKAKSKDIIIYANFSWAKKELCIAGYKHSKVYHNDPC